MTSELFGEFLLRKGLIKSQDLARLKDFQKTINMPIGQYAIEPRHVNYHFCKKKFSNSSKKNASCSAIRQ